MNSELQFPQPKYPPFDMSITLISIFTNLYQSYSSVILQQYKNMNSFDWQKAWQRQYNNTSDDKWKTKSLNPMQEESYQIKLPKAKKPTKTAIKGEGERRQNKEEVGTGSLPSPTLTKINETMFCISLQRQLNLFYLPQLQNQDRLKKPKKTFYKIEYDLDHQISKIIGLTTPQKEDYILVATSNSLIVLKITKNKQAEYSIVKVQQKDIPVPDFRIFLCFGGTRIIAISSSLLYEFQLVNDKLRQIVTKKIEFSNKEDQAAFKGLTPIGLVAGYGKNFYYFGSKEEERLDVNKIKGAEDNPKIGQCQALTIVKLNVSGKNDIESVAAEIYPIDYIFDKKMFTRTKIFEIERDTFLFSLHEEIVLIKKNFNKYIVWDNVSVVSSKSQSKKGQLILVSQTILVYSEPSEIFAHQIYFDENKSKLEMPTIDNFKGKEDQECVLYDALMLQTEDSIIKVLAYIRQADVVYPGTPRMIDIDKSKPKQPPTNLGFTLICINQNDPKKKLQTLIENNLKFNKPTTQEIDDFCSRFHILPQDLKKCEWNVSQKKQKDIENILMVIKDDDFIKAELDNILKQESHDLNFLGKVEDKQLERLNGILNEKILQYTKLMTTQTEEEYRQAKAKELEARAKQMEARAKWLEANPHLISNEPQQAQKEDASNLASNQPQERRMTNAEKRTALKAQKTYIFGILKWIMQSQMFRKKVNYSSKFLTFKQYDFIEIGKLRAASLKEEIKLLSQKKYVKRLKHFINEFKNLVIANFEEVFTFLLTGKSVSEIQKFIHQFNFVLPRLPEQSPVFHQRKDTLIFKKEEEIKVKVAAAKRQRTMSFNVSTPNEMPLPTIRFDVNERSRSREKSRDKSKADEKEGKLKQSRVEEEKIINETRCYLWGEDEENVVVKTEELEIPETLQAFLKKRSQQINKSDKDHEKDAATKNLQIAAVKNLEILLNEFQNDNWFKVAAFKQHCMVTKTSEQIRKEYIELKQDKSFLILIKFLYKQLSNLQKSGGTQQQIRQAKKKRNEEIEKLLNYFIQKELVAESFVRNVDARIKVYELLRPLANRSQDKKTVSIQLPKFEEFLVKSQPEYFSQIFEHIRSKILTQVMPIYDYIQRGFFKERFGIYLSSSHITPEQAIDFLDEFKEELSQEEGIDKIRYDVFNTIKRLLRLSDRENTKKYVIKSLDKSILPEYDENHTDKLRDEAKIPYGSFFYYLFAAFDLNYTYEELINFTIESNIELNEIINVLVQKYCREEYEKHYDYDEKKEVCRIAFEDFGINMGSNEKIPPIDIHKQPLEFFGLLLIFLSNLDFLVQDTQVFDLMMLNYLNLNKFKQLSDFISKLLNYHISSDNMSTKNYQMIRDFKDESDISQMFIANTLGWIKQTYASIKTIHDSTHNISHLQEKMTSVERALNMLEVFHKNLPQIKRERALFILLTYLKNFEPRIVITVEQIQRQALSNSGFIFLMHMFKKIGIEKFTTVSAGEDNPTKVQNFFRIFESHQEYVKGQKVDYFHPEFLRFLIQICFMMIENKKFHMAHYLILYKIPNENEYFIDVILMFLAAAQYDKKKSGFSDAVMKQILTPQTTSLIRNNLQTIINTYNVRGFIETKIDPSATLAELDKVDFYQRCRGIFKLTMSRYRKHDAFFFLARVKVIRNASLKNLASTYASYNIPPQEQNIEICSFFLVTSYIKVLQLYIQKEFYPTFRFFESKTLILSDPKIRMDMIKDINIAMSKLQRLSSKNSGDITLSILEEQLRQQYQNYMAAIGQEADIKLVDPDARGISGTTRAQIFSRSKNLAKEEEERHREIVQHKKIIQENINRTHQVQEEGRLNVLKKNINEEVSQIRKITERHAALEADMRREKDSNQTNIAQKKAKELEEIKKKEKEDIESIKDTYKSNTTKRVTDLIQNLRKKREEVKARTYAPISAVREFSEKEKNVGNMGDSHTHTVRSPTERQNFTKPPQILQVPQLSLPSIPLQQQYAMQSQLPQSFYVSKETQQMVSHSIQTKKVNFEDIAKLYKEGGESDEALRCIQKYDMLKNTSVRGQLIKRAFAVTNNLDNFLQFLKYLMDSDPTWKESIEEKSIPIAAQMLKMQPKQKITIKQIIPVDLFTKVTKISMKDYYSVAFDIFKPKLIKILEKELMAVHAVGILFRYSLGSQNRFYSKVFYEYFNVLLNNYQLKNFDDKEMVMLAEKIRSNYSNLPDTKTEILEKLLQKITNPQKKNRLLQALMKIIERKGESLVGGQSNKQIAFVVQRLMKT